MSAFRKVAVAGLLAATALTAGACSSGQISQTAVQVPAVNGNQANVGPIALRDVRIDFPGAVGGNAADQGFTNTKGGHALLLFTAINNSAAQADRLVGISSDAGDVTLHGLSGDLPAGTSHGKLVAGRIPADQAAAQQAADMTAGPAPVYVTIDNLNRDLTPGLTIDVRFAFEHAGTVDVQVPIDAGSAPR